MMINSKFFKEAAYVANYALKRSHPIEAIPYGINKLRFVRKGYCKEQNIEFSEEKFNKFAKHYEKIAHSMITNYLNYKEENK